ncbi:hypothetical protein Pla123a_21930 [Posidoniimonas polymericola]|uniref:Uncharacterized protein n=1 Tax=Posidoniimonas polymericola TaxID=2528002 RepID=A0A5C5YRG6_9BACT|nr:hypothetical protein [Posidoniimonas polymericola]TWT77532.1 hypothetical protein Pla123a_21930 [Posidoniimonas polymericola]
MRRNLVAAAALAACLTGAESRALDVDPCLAGVGENESAIELCGYSSGCCAAAGPVVTFDVDFLFMKYYQSGGVQSSDAGEIIGGGDNAEFDFSLSPRFTLGVETCDGLGARVRYWFFDETARTADNSGFVSVDAYTFDAEIFKRVQLGRSTTIEGFGGVRWSEFNLDDDTDLDWRVDGVGLTTGFEISHYLTCNHRLYAGTRLAVVVGDALLADNGDLDDSTGLGVSNTQLQVELAAGYEGKTNLGRGVTMVYGAGAELHNWSDAAIKADASDEAYLTDSGFAGFTFRLGAEY